MASFALQRCSWTLSCVFRQLAETFVSFWTDWRCWGPAGYKLSGSTLLYTSEFKGRGGVNGYHNTDLCLNIAIFWGFCVYVSQVKFTSAVKLSESGAVGPEYARDEEENFFKRLGKWRSGRRNPSKLHHTEEKDGRPPRPWGAHPRPPPIVLSLFLSPASCLSVWCRVLSRKVVVFFRPPFSMSAPPDSCLLHSVSTLLAWMCYFKPISV